MVVGQGEFDHFSRKDGHKKRLRHEMNEMSSTFEQTWLSCLRMGQERGKPVRGRKKRTENILLLLYILMLGLVVKLQSDD